jgi:hypothetical protein
MSITWTASNKGCHLIGERPATTVLAAVRDGREFVRGELNGEGKITIYEDGVEIREDRCDMFTAWKWQVTNL